VNNVLEPAEPGEQVGLIGLGVMGSAIAALLLRSGTAVLGYDIADNKMDHLQVSGGQPMGSPAEVGAQCQIILTSLPTAGAFHDVISGPQGLAGTGSLVVEMSTLSLADKKRGKEALESGGGQLVDAPLSGTGAQAATGDLVTFVSADHAADRAAAAAMLARFTRAQYDVGEFGNGSRFKYVANLLVAIHNVAAAEALVLAERAGLDLSLVLAAVADGAGGSRMLDIRGPLMAAGSYDDPSVRLQVFMKDLDLIAEFAEALGAPVPMLAASRRIYDAAAAAGRSDQDTACVVEVMRQAAAGGKRS
jgi:L-threonate 2-dehydrogenase